MTGLIEEVWPNCWVATRILFPLWNSNKEKTQYVNGKTLCIKLHIEYVWQIYCIFVHIKCNIYNPM